MDVVDVPFVDGPKNISIVIQRETANHHFILPIRIQICNANGVSTLAPSTFQFLQFFR